jgi:hypothetical protein
VRQPGPARFRVARHRQAVGEADLRRVDVAVGQRRKGKLLADAALEFGRERAARLAQRTRLGLVFGVRIAPLRDEAVLHAQDRQPVEVVLARHRAEVRRVQRRVGGGEFDHHASGGEVEVQRVVRIERAPVGRLGGFEDLLHRPRLGRRVRVTVEHGQGQGAYGEGAQAPRERPLEPIHANLHAGNDSGRLYPIARDVRSTATLG